MESATQETDPTTVAGDFQQNIYFIFSKMETDLRRQKVMAGMQEMMRKGYLPNRAPIGYRHVKGADWDNRIVIDEKIGPLIKKAFELKADYGKTNTEIANILNKAGLKLDRKRLSDVLRNPFYCGILINKFLPGEIIQGKHPKLISEKIFLKANDKNLHTRYGQRQQRERSEFPLKQFAKCDCCSGPLTAYSVKRKKATYYKCNTPGCQFNRNANVMHEKFVDRLRRFAPEQKSAKPLERIMK